MRRPELRGLPGVLSREQLMQTVDAIAAAQQPCGSLPWPDGHTDAWDHVECAMVLTAGGRLDEARAGYAWLRKTQKADGSWATSYDQLEILDPMVDLNQCAYVAVGIWQWLQVTGDRTLPEQMWPHIRRALDLVCDMQAPTGEIYWAADDGVARREALLTGSSSIYQSLRCGIALAELFGEPQPEWELAAGLLQHAVAHHPDLFMDKSRFSMDWYYPVLGGAVRGRLAAELFDAHWDTFVVPGLGIRCVSDEPWVTGAETAELALALLVSGEPDKARQLLKDVQHLRHDDGSYWTGYVFDKQVRWPAERSSWTAAAMVLCADALAGGYSLQLFDGRDLPTGVLLPADTCLEDGAPCGDLARRV
jgi:hypothetical protein